MILHSPPPPPPPNNLTGNNGGSAEHADRQAEPDGSTDGGNGNWPVEHNGGNGGGPVKLDGKSNGSARIDPTDQIGSLPEVPDGIGGKEIGSQDRGQDPPPLPPPGDS